ncbi:MAG: hypothetical protein US70_C0011G0003 [Parcubacteria group bacterium GW2011_GWD2_38_11]|nr:MAG: hypothetical protein US70_C0011G0003 [Parcubacteria group bacterium GW2011_GWD2_38_11]
MAQAKKKPNVSLKVLISTIRFKVLSLISKVLTIRNLAIVISALLLFIGSHLFKQQQLLQKTKWESDYAQKKKITEDKKTMFWVSKTSLQGNSDKRLWLKTKMEFSIKKELAVPDMEDSEKFYFKANNFPNYFEYSVCDTYGSELLLRPPPKSNKPDFNKSGLLFYLDSSFEKIFTQQQQIFPLVLCILGKFQEPLLTQVVRRLGKQNIFAQQDLRHFQFHSRLK